MSVLSLYNSGISPEPEQFPFRPFDLATESLVCLTLQEKDLLSSGQFIPIADRHRNQIRSPVIQEELISDLLCHLDIQKSVEPGGLHPGY